MYNVVSPFVHARSRLTNCGLKVPNRRVSYPSIFYLTSLTLFRCSLNGVFFHLLLLAWRVLVFILSSLFRGISKAGGLMQARLRARTSDLSASATIVLLRLV